jgi:hypothetical protein
VLVALILFTCTGLLVYWLARTALLMRGSEESIEEALRHDLWFAHQILLWLRILFTPGSQFSAPN